MSTRAIRTSTEQTICDVCGRTLLRGERAEVYIGGGDRHTVCPLCTARALHGGWVREGTMPDYDPAGSRVDRRRGLFGRKRRREAGSGDLYEADENPFGDEFFGDGEPASLPPAPGVAASSAPAADPALSDAPDAAAADPAADSTAPAPDWLDAPARGERSRPRRRRNGSGSTPGREQPTASKRDSALSRLGREPRHIRAVPTSIEHKIASAVALFNQSEHPRTVAGIARSLGLPDVAVHPRDPVASAVDIVISWELCWYRYEVDLSDEVPAVRAAGQGYELDELSALERQLNATADDRGLLVL